MVFKVVMKIKEGALVFSSVTADGSQAIKYDNTKFYRNQFINIASGTKAVDAHLRIIGSNAQPFHWLQVSGLPFQSQ